MTELIHGSCLRRWTRCDKPIAASELQHEKTGVITCFSCLSNIERVKSGDVYKEAYRIPESSLIDTRGP